MLTIGVGEIQKNISIFRNLTEAVEIIDKRKHKTLGIVYPVKQNSVIKNLAGKYKNRIQKSNLSLKEIKEISLMKAMKEKYDLSS